MDYVIVSYDENTGDVVQDTLVTPPEPLEPIQPPQCSRLQPCDIIEDYGKIGGSNGLNAARIEKPVHVDGMTEYIDIHDALDIPRPARVVEAPADEEPLSDSSDSDDSSTSSDSSDSSDSDLGLRMHTADYLSSKHQPIATSSPVARHRSSPPLDRIRIDVIKKIMSDALLAKPRHVRHYHKRSNDIGVDMFRHPKP